MDCEKLTPNALKIFEKIKSLYPPDPWGHGQWEEEGRIYDNGWHDLRKEQDREKLIKWYAHMIGSSVITFAEAQQMKTGKFTKKSFHFKMSKEWILKALILRELDYQIETQD
ncbi:hypothetical protein KW791_02395 [Candidatus Parcubacteria bacterium]|nr:hypothetical protein [Candidatus Parcubacteria bacterium]